MNNEIKNEEIIIKPSSEEKPQLAQEDKPKKKKSKKWILIVIIIVSLIGGGIGGFFAYTNSPSVLYSQAVALLDENNYEEAVEILNQIYDYEDSQELIETANYDRVMQIANDGDYDAAIDLAQEVLSDDVYDEVILAFDAEILCIEEILEIKSDLEALYGYSIDLTITQIRHFALIDRPDAPMILVEFSVVNSSNNTVNFTYLLAYTESSNSFLSQNYATSTQVQYLVDWFLEGDDIYEEFEVISSDRIANNVE